MKGILVGLVVVLATGYLVYASFFSQDDDWIKEDHFQSVMVGGGNHFVTYTGDLEKTDGEYLMRNVYAWHKGKLVRLDEQNSGIREPIIIKGSFIGANLDPESDPAQRIEEELEHRERIGKD